MEEQDNSQQADESIPEGFYTWYRNGCTSNTMEQTIAYFQSLAQPEQDNLIGEFQTARKRLSDSSYRYSFYSGPFEG